MILVTNDDGVDSAALPLLLDALKDFGPVGVFPSSERSWIGKAISKQALHVGKAKVGRHSVFSVNGTPADCVQLGIHHLLSERPQLVVSGINYGSNIGHPYVLSSGTIGACLEAGIAGIKSVALSLHKRRISKKDFEVPARIGGDIVRKALGGFDADILIVNFPEDCTEDAEIKVTKMAKFDYGSLYKKAGRRYVHRGYSDYCPYVPDTDVSAVLDGKISITPVDIELASKNIESVRRQFAIAKR